MGLILALALLALLSLPILKRHLVDSRAGVSQDFREVALRQLKTYEDIQSLSMDHELGHVPEQEYHQRLQVHRLEAARALRDGEMVRQVLELRGQQVEDRVLELRRSWGTVASLTSCEGCGGEVDAKAAVCPRCELRRNGEGTPEAAPGAGEGAVWSEQ